ASDVYIGNLSVEAALLSFIEEGREERARVREELLQQREQFREHQEQVKQQFKAHQERMDELGQRMDRTEREVHNIAQAMRTMAKRMDARFSALEAAVRPL